MVVELKDGTNTLYFRPIGQDNQVLSRGALILRSGKTNVLQHSKVSPVLKRSKVALKQCTELVARVQGGVVDDGPQPDDFQLVDVDVNVPKIKRLTSIEKRELRGVPMPS